MDCLYHHAHDIDAGGKRVQSCLQFLLEIADKGLAVLAQNGRQGVAGEIAGQHAARRGPDQVVGRFQAVGGAQRGIVGEPDAIGDAQIHIDDFEILATILVAGHQIAGFGGARGFPQPVGGGRLRPLDGGFLNQRLFGHRLAVDLLVQEGDGNLVHHAIFDRLETAERPGQIDMQAWMENALGVSEGLVNGALVEGEGGDTGHQPAADGQARRYRQKRAPDEAQRPAPAQVDAKLAADGGLDGTEAGLLQSQQAGEQAVAVAPFGQGRQRQENEAGAAQGQFQRHQEGKDENHTLDGECERQGEPAQGIGQPQSHKRENQQAHDIGKRLGFGYQSGAKGGEAALQHQQRESQHDHRTDDGLVPRDRGHDAAKMPGLVARK